VVIAIISLLVAILMPALSSAKEQAARAACMPTCTPAAWRSPCRARPRRQASFLAHGGRQPGRTSQHSRESLYNPNGPAQRAIPGWDQLSAELLKSSAGSATGGCPNVTSGAVAAGEPLYASYVGGTPITNENWNDPRARSAPS